MPRKAKRPCRFKNCPALTDSASGYCQEHEKPTLQEQRRIYNQFGRTPEAKKRYNYQWRKLRAFFIARNPFCEMCKRQGKFTAATEVHHIKPLADGGTNDFENLMPLCKSCHSKITATGTTPPPTEKIPFSKIAGGGGVKAATQGGY